MKKYLIVLIAWAFTFSQFDGCKSNNQPHVRIKGPFPSYDACNNARKTYDTDETYTTTVCWEIPDPGQRRTLGALEEKYNILSRQHEKVRKRLPDAKVILE